MMATGRTPLGAWRHAAAYEIFITYQIFEATCLGEQMFGVFDFIGIIRVRALLSGDLAHAHQGPTRYSIQGIPYLCQTPPRGFSTHIPGPYTGLRRC